MKNPFKNKIFRRCFWSILAITLLVLVFRVPTRLSAAAFNKQTDLPIGLLEKGADFSQFTFRGGFGMVSYDRYDDNGSLRYDVSRWPGMLFGRQQTTYIICTDPDFTICGISVGDDMDAVAQILEQHGFSQGRNDHQFIRFGVIISCHTEWGTDKIKEIAVAARGSISILPVVF